MRIRGAETPGTDHQRCGRGSVGRRMGTGIVGTVCPKHYYLVSGAWACWRRSVNVLFTVEVWIYNHAMGSSVLA